MAKKTKTEAPAVPAVIEAPPQPEIPAAAVEPTKAKTKKVKTTKKVEVKEEVVEVPAVPVAPEPEVVVDDEIIPPVAEEAAVPAVAVEKKRRRVVTKATLLEAIEEFHGELIPILEAGGHKKLIKQFKQIQTDTYKLLKIKTAQKKQKDATNSGFMRPVKPSVALETFLQRIGDTNTEPLTRAYLTTLICKYIKEKDLQNPKDRRIIFPDIELKTLFQIKDDDTEPLTYYNIQKKIQPHVSRIEDVEVHA